MTGKPVRMSKVGFINLGEKNNKKVNLNINHSNFFMLYDYLFVPVYRLVSPAPVFNSRVAAETADTVRLAGVEETSLCQSVCRHLLSQVGATERIHAKVHFGKIKWTVCLPDGILTESTHDRNRKL